VRSESDVESGKPRDARDPKALAVSPMSMQAIAAVTFANLSMINSSSYIIQLAFAFASNLVLNSHLFPQLLDRKNSARDSNDDSEGTNDNAENDWYAPRRSGIGASIWLRRLGGHREG
jgi:hypothetical protein